MDASLNLPGNFIRRGGSLTHVQIHASGSPHVEAAYVGSARVPTPGLESPRAQIVI
jgi:hypothetical protein